MSRPSSAYRVRRRLNRARNSDEGFSLVEVMVAMLVFAVVAVTSLSFLTTALAATAVARLEGIAKNIGQERLEGMRNLPFHIAHNVSTAPDLLDTYYTGTGTTAPNTFSTGWVASGGARDTANGDPATGAFFRRVFAAGSITGYPGFSQRIATQLIEDKGTVLPDTTFDTNSDTLTGQKPASTVAVQVTTLWTAQGKAKRSTVYSQITAAAARPPLVTLQARLAMVRYSGLLPFNRELVAEAGLLSLDGSLTTSTSASAVSQGAAAVIAGATRVDGAKQTAVAPPSSTIGLSASQSPKTLDDGGDRIAELSNSAVSGVSATAVNGQPGAATTAAPATARLLGGGGFGQPDLVFGADNRPDRLSRLSLVGSTVQLRKASCGGSCVTVEGNGSLTSVAGASHSATANLAGVLNGTLVVFPTLQSPDGVLQVELTSFTASCDSRSGAGASASMTYAGTLRYRTYNAGVYGYASQPLSSSSGTDPLAGVNLATTVVGVDALNMPLYLGDYVQSWSSLTAGAITAGKQLASNGSAVSLAMPGVLTIASRPLRLEAESVIGVQVAAASCVAADVR